MKDDVRDNILSPAQWLRILYMLMFALISWALGIVLTVLIVLQALFSLVTGGDNENLRRLGGALSKYYYQILLFLTYQSDDKPFPFAPFPDTPAAPPLDPVAPAGAPRHASTVNTPQPVATPDFLAEHEPEASGSASAQAAGAARSAPAEEDDVFAGISFTGPRTAPRPAAAPDSPAVQTDAAPVATGQGTTERAIAEAGSTEEGNTEQGSAEQGSAEQENLMGESTEQGGAGQGVTEQAVTEQESAEQAPDAAEKIIAADDAPEIEARDEALPEERKPEAGA